MRTAGLAVGLAGCAGIVMIGARFFAVPERATRDYGVAPQDVLSLTRIKGARDITSGLVGVVALAAGGPRVFGRVLMAAALTPVIDAEIVLASGGSRAVALGVHGGTAVAMLLAGAALVRES